MLLNSLKRACLLLLIFLVISLFVSMIKSAEMYSVLKAQKRGWVGDLFTYDATLGFSSVSGGKGYELFFDKKIPVRLGYYGERLAGNHGLCEKKIVVLGDSFSFGAAVSTNKNFSSILSSKGYCVYNLGVPGYGLVQMLLQSQKLLKDISPDYVVVQYSPWLTERAVKHYSPALHSYMPAPYFGKDSYINPPLFESSVFSVDLDRFRDTEKGLYDFLAYFLAVGLQVNYLDAVKAIYYSLAREAECLECMPNAEMQLYSEIYHEIVSVSATPLLLPLGADQNPVNPGGYLRGLYGNVVDAHGSLLAYLDANERGAGSFSEAFTHWGGTPRRQIDGHPNELAHYLIADEIYRSIGSD